MVQSQIVYDIHILQDIAVQTATIPVKAELLCNLVNRDISLEQKKNLQLINNRISPSRDTIYYHCHGTYRNSSINELSGHEERRYMQF